jgi:hypothetical protein
MVRVNERWISLSLRRGPSLQHFKAILDPDRSRVVSPDIYDNSYTLYVAATVYLAAFLVCELFASSRERP